MIYPELGGKLMHHYALDDREQEGLKVALGAHIRHGAPICSGPEREVTTEV